MRRLMPAIAAAVVMLTLAGCGLIESLPISGTGPKGPWPENFTAGSCLDRRNGIDSDRTSVVDCAQPHLFEITSVAAWPGFNDALDEAHGDVGAVWDAIHLAGATEESVEYGVWAARVCTEGAQRTIGLDGVEVDGHAAAELLLRVGGTYSVESSLATRSDMVNNGDAATVCALAWPDETGMPRLLDGPLFTELLHPGFEPGRRECWDADSNPVPCGQPHAAQVLLGFDGLEAFGPDLIARAAVGEPTETDRAIGDEFCDELMQEAMPASFDLGGLVLRSAVAAGAAWEEFDGTVDPLGGYFYACLAVAPGTALISGDVFNGTAA